MPVNNFELLRNQETKELNTVAKLYRHTRTGTELLSLVNDDENKVFGITFRTPPYDSTGLPHILEHSVLCGSRKYPVKEPFVEILKGSLQTFLNAFTYPDKTCYPVASQNTQDFYNLVDVYLDAVFYPRITRHIFQQEGWHYEVDGKNDSLTYKGVVFNEMKGVYSSPDGRLERYSQRSLFPDNTYGLDSGGDPKRIPDLTYERFVDFHRRYYHPSNARIFFYGDDDPETRLHIIDEYLKDFDKLDTNSTISLQTGFESPKKAIFTFPSGEDETSQPKGMLMVNWLITEAMEVETKMALGILEYILIGMPGSPLRKALMDSGLGEDISSGSGLESELKQMFFSVGLKGIDTKKAEEIESLILDTLKELSEKGIDPKTTEAAVNTTEFLLRENNTGSYPRGLIIMLRCLTTWLYDGDPFAMLGFESRLSKIKSDIKSDKMYFEKIIDRQLLKNTHRTTVILKPDPDLGEKEEEKEKEELADIRKNMDLSELKEIAENSACLKKMQATPDSPEALATIPMLGLKDLDKKNKILPIDVTEEKGTKILYHGLPTNGIVYIDIGFDLHVLPQKYIQYVPLLSRALLEMGTEKEDYVELSQRIGRKTGGIHPSLLTSETKNTKKAEIRLFLRGKATTAQTGDLLGIIEDVLLNVLTDNQKRFKQMVMEEKARHEQSIVPSGHHIVNTRLRSHFGEAGWIAEQMGGISYLFFLRRLVEEIDKNWGSVSATLKDMLNIIVSSNTAVFNVTADEKERTYIESELFKFTNKLPRGPAGTVEWLPEPSDTFEAMTIPAQVNYVGKGSDLYKTGYAYHGSAKVITRYLSTTWLWDRVRVQGGAYGASCSFNRLSGGLTFLSYRDPNIIETLKNFDEAAMFLKKTDLTESELTRGIIGAIGDIDTYMLPDAKGYASMIRNLIGVTEEDLQKIRDEILSTTVNDFRMFAEVLAAVSKNGIVKVLGSENAVKGAAEGHLPFKIFKVL